MGSTGLLKNGSSGIGQRGVSAAARGDLQAAIKCFVRTRDYCTSSKHLEGMCLSVVRVSLELGSFLHVANYVQKAEATPDKDAEPLVQAKLGAAMGLANLAQKKYRLAARTLCAVPAEIGTSYNDVIAPQDIATSVSYTHLRAHET